MNGDMSRAARIDLYRVAMKRDDPARHRHQVRPAHHVKSLGIDMLDQGPYADLVSVYVPHFSPFNQSSKRTAPSVTSWTFLARS